jgi:hypothetical protein
MSTVRLNQGMRDTIMGRLMKHAFEKRELDLRKEDTKLADDVYDDIYPKDIKKKMADLPAEFFLSVQHLKVSFAGQFEQVVMSAARPASKRHDYNAAKVYDAKDPLSVRYFEIGKTRTKLREDRARAKSAARAALDSCSTIKQLLEVWPEAGAFVADFTAPPKTRALTLSIKDLNKTLGLP